MPTRYASPAGATAHSVSPPRGTMLARRSARRANRPPPPAHLGARPLLRLQRHRGPARSHWRQRHLRDPAVAPLPVGGRHQDRPPLRRQRRAVDVRQAAAPLGGPPRPRVRALEPALRRRRGRPLAAAAGGPARCVPGGVPPRDPPHPRRARRRHQLGSGRLRLGRMSGDDAAILSPGTPSAGHLGHLVTRTDPCGAASAPTWQDKGFLAWDPESTSRHRGSRIRPPSRPRSRRW